MTTPKDTQAVAQVKGPDGELMPAGELTLGVEKFFRSEKHYRLIWMDGFDAWLCQEDTTAYRRVWGDDGVMEAGKLLAEKLEAKRFSGVVR